MNVTADLLAAITADPDDPDPQLVLADSLLSAGDPRGELIVLDHRDRSTPGGLADRDAIERMLLLAAEYGFPDARHRIEPMLPFVGGGSYPVQYDLDHGGHHYLVLYRHDSLGQNLRVEIDDDAIFPSEPITLAPGEWTAGETRVILTVLGDAIRAGTPLAELEFPLGDLTFPIHDGAPLRCYPLPREFTAPRGLTRYRYGLAARDYHRWHALWHRLERLAPSP